MPESAVGTPGSASHAGAIARLVTGYLGAAAVPHDLLEAVLADMPNAVIVAEAPSGRLLLGNPAVERVWRHRMLHSGTIPDYKEWRGFHPDGRPYEPHEWPLARALVAGETVMHEEIRILRGDGTTAWIDVNAAPVRDGTGRVVAGVTVFEDVTERHRAAAALVEQRDLFESLARAHGALGLGVAVTHGDRIVHVNDAFARMLQYDAGELTAPRFDVRRLLPANAGDRGDSFLGARPHGAGSRRRSLRLVRRDGESIAVETMTTAVRGRGGHGLTLTVVRDATSEGQAREPLERAVRERTRELAVANRELEAFNYSVAHDLREPLRAVEQLAHALREDHGKGMDADAHRVVDLMARSARRMMGLVEDLLALSSVAKKDLRLEDVDVAAAAERAYGIVREREEPGRDVRLVVTPRVAATRVRADPRLLGVVLENLLSNALKYTRPVPHALVELDARDGPAPGVRTFLVRDNGVGFDPARADGMFAAFQRFHSQSEFEGTGVGLATVARVVRRHGGDAWAEGAPGKGATFYFTLPVVSDGA